MTGMVIVRLVGGARDGEEVRCPSWRLDELRQQPDRSFDDIVVVETVARATERGARVPDKDEMPMDAARA